MALTFKDVTDQFIALADAGFAAENQNNELITWRRVHPGRTEKLCIHYRHRIQDGFYIGHISAAIQFHELEELFDTVMRKYPFRPQYPIHRGETIYTTVIATNEAGGEIFEKEIDTLEKLEKASKEVWKIMEKVAFPFLEKYNNLKAINEEADKRTLQELIGFIESPPPVRRLLIKKFCGDPAFDEYGQWLLNGSAGTDTEEIYKQIYQYVKAYTIPEITP